MSDAAVEITGCTRLLALIADPVAQARSPRAVNRLLAERGRGGEFVMVAMKVAPAGLPAAIAGLRAIESFAGAVVSMPHKETIVRLLDGLTEEAALTRVVNVFRREEGGHLVGTILDGEGFVAGLRAAGHEVRGARCLLVGAGGAATAIAFRLAREGCGALTIVNRTAARGQSLASRVAAAFPGVAVSASAADRLAGRDFDLAINGTSLGMNAGDPLPIALDVVRRSRVVAECVAAVEITPLLAAARDAGRAIHTGVPMLTSQLELLVDFLVGGAS